MNPMSIAPPTGIAAQVLTDDEHAVGAALLSRAAKLGPVLAERVPETLAGRAVAAKNIEDLRAAELFLCSTPRRFGGHEITPHYYWRIAAELARGCASTSWVFNIFNGHAHVLSLFPEEAQDEIFGADPQVGICGVLPDKTTATPVDGGFVLKKSKWPFASGSPNAQWAQLGAKVVGLPPGQDNAFFMVPMEQVELVDDWYVTGLRGTGSNSVRLIEQDTFVPARRMLSGAVALAHKMGASRTKRYRAPFAPLLTLILSAGTAIGNAEAALETFEDFVLNRSKRKLVYTNDALKRDLPSVRRTIAEATVRIEQAKAVADRVADLSWQAAAAPDRVLSNRERALMRLLTANLGAECREAVLALFRESGGSALQEDNLVGRRAADAQAMTMHEAQDLGVLQDVYGRTVLGQGHGHWLL